MNFSEIFKRLFAKIKKQQEESDKIEKQNIEVPKLIPIQIKKSVIKPVIKKENNDILILIDPGHGGMINDKYQTAGKRSPIWEDGTQLFEGVSNRITAKNLHEELNKVNIKSIILVPEEEDIPLWKRVKRANKYWNDHILNDGPLPILISLHSNAASTPMATGWEIFTTRGDTPSDPYATIVYEEAIKEFPEFRMRTDFSDSDPDKESNFSIIAKYKGPAMLIENFFMTTYDPDCLLLMSEEGHKRISNYLRNAVLRF